MASLGMILAGSGIGNGLAQLPQRISQAESDNQRQKAWGYQNNEMDRVRQQQGIEDQTVDGATDEDRLRNLADLAGAAGRGDLQRKYQAAASKAKEEAQLRAVAGASRAIMMGQFGPATQMLNQTGMFGQIHSIVPTTDPEHQDPNNPAYDVFTAGPPDANGNPTQGPHVIVNQQMLYALQSKPGEALHWMTAAQNNAQRNDQSDRRLDQGDRRLNQVDTRLQEAERHNQAMEAARRTAGATGAGGRLTDQRWRYQWATTPAERGGGGMTPQQAMAWAQDPNKDRKDYWQSVKLGGQVAQSGGMFTADDVIKIAGAFNQGKPTSPFAGSPIAAPEQAAAPDFKALGFTQDPASGNWKNPKTGVWFKTVGNQSLAWSNSKKAWVPVQ